jgi:putative PEP-CTERM system integral membrane protein
MNDYATPFVRKLLNPRIWAYGLFWSWNIVFLAFMLLGFAPSLLPDMITAVQADTVPATFLANAVLLTIIPVIAVILGLTLLRRSPGRLVTLGYGVEGPLMLILAVRFFVVREMTPAVGLLLGMGILGIATLLWQLLDRNIEARGSALAHLRVIGLTLLLLIGLYAAAWLAFYAVPLAAQTGQILSELARSGRTALEELDWRWLPFWILGIVLAAYTATLFVVMPVVVPILYFRAWWRGIRPLRSTYGWPRPAALTIAVLATCAILFVQTNRQPQRLAFELLETPPATPADAQALLDRQGAIRNGLLNAYLAPVRYVSAVGEVRHVSAMYEQALHMSPVQAWQVQRLYETVARPVLYTPVNPREAPTRADLRALTQEPLKAAELYETFFDESIVDGEREAIVRAVRSTWSIDQAQAAWQAIDDREVHLMRQEVTIDEKGDWADAELYEVYQNQTGQRQEVVYYFSLPESAVVTGLWLGYSPDRDARFSYRVSPRGAAQALYRNEVNYSRDPALVEQIGPRQYRLRIFPIPPQGLRWDDDASGHSHVVEGPPLHMWLTWRVLARKDVWPMPHLAERRNVYWDDTTVRVLNGESVVVDDMAWLPASVQATAPVVPVEHRIEFPSGEVVLVRPAPADDLPALPEDLRLAVVLDRSRSMAERASSVDSALARLDAATGPDTAVDVYLTASRYRGEDPARIELISLDPDSVMYFGGQNAAELLAQFDQLHTDQDYDAILVITDGSGYELGASDIDAPVPDAPVWMVHLDADFPLGYDDATLEAIQASGGGVTGDIEEALMRLAIALSADQKTSSSDVIDGYIWSTIAGEAGETNNAAEVHNADDDFAALGARHLILDTMHRQSDAMDQLGTLNHLHAIAVQQGIVTPYSSMIVLVNNRQENLLDRLEAGADRFQREQEAVGETLPQSPFSVTGVPEPEEWLLLAMAGAMLLWYARTKASGILTHTSGDRRL